MFTITLTNTGDPIVDGLGRPAAGVAITFYLVDSKGHATDGWDVISGERILPGPFRVLTDATGVFTTPLWPTSRGDRLLYWKCSVAIDGVQDFKNGVAEGTNPLSFIAFRFGGVAPTPQQYALWAMVTGGVATKAILDAAAGAYADGQCLFVTNDATPANNGTWRKSGAGWVQASFDRVAALENKERYTRYTNALYASDFASGFFTGTNVTPASCATALVSNSAWSAIGVRKALQVLLLGAWTGGAIKYMWDVNKLADAMATTAISGGTPADFHPGDTVYYRFSYRSTKDFSFGLFSCRAGGLYDSALGSVNVPNSSGAVVEIAGSYPHTSAAADQAYLVPRIYGGTGQTYALNDYIEVAGMVIQNTPIGAGVVCLHATKDDALAATAGAGITVTKDLVNRTATIAATYDATRTTSLETRATTVEGRATALEVKRRTTRYDNLLKNTAYEDGVTVSVQNAAYAPAVIAAAGAPWLPLGIKKVLNFTLAQIWNNAGYKYFFYASRYADGLATFSTNGGDATDFHQEDTLYYRFRYRSSAAISAQIQNLNNIDGWLSIYQSIALPSTAGAVVEIAGSFLLNNADANQKYITLAVYGGTAQNYVAGDYLEVADLVFSKTAIDSGFVYRHPTKDEPLAIVAGTGITTTDDLAARTKTVSLGSNTLRRLTRYDNLLKSMQYLTGIVAGVVQDPANVTLAIAGSAAWYALGINRVVQMTVRPATWTGAITKYMWQSNGVAEGSATFSTNGGAATDLHQGDTVYWRVRYRSSAATYLQIQARSAADGWLGIYQSNLLPATAGAVLEATGSWLLNNSDANQAFITAMFYGATSQNFVQGDYLEVADLVFSKAAIDGAKVYLHPTDPTVLAANFVPNPNPRGKRFLIFGDSITATATSIDQTTGAYVEGSSTANWPSYAKAQLGMSAMVNYAASGAHFKDDAGLTFWQYMSNQVAKAIEFGTPADIIVVKLGTNDGTTNLGDFTTAMGKATLADLDRTKLYEAIRWCYLSIATNWPNAVCFAVLPIQRASTAPSALQPMYDAITAMAKAYNFRIIDATSESGIVRDFETVGVAGRDLYDGLHPGTTGKIKLANLICSKINNAFNY